LSFILDALKKSETERQQQAGTEFATVPTREPAPRRNLWFWLLGLLLAVNLVVLTGILLRPAADVPAAAPPETETVPAPAAAREVRPEDDFAARVASARRSLPVQQAAAEPGERPEPAPAADSVRPAGGIVAQPAATARIPTIDELRLEGLLELPELRIDIHVYSDDPAERFVFINMNKQREKSLLPAGPVVREIRPDGVVLEYRGRAFLLPRE
jgi:general secretion pathway protein B